MGMKKSEEDFLVRRRNIDLAIILPEFVSIRFCDGPSFEGFGFYQFLKVNDQWVRLLCVRNGFRQGNDRIIF